MIKVNDEDVNLLVHHVIKMRQQEELYKKNRLSKHNIEYREYQKKIDQLLNKINTYQ